MEYLAVYDEGEGLETARFKNMRELRTFFGVRPDFCIVRKEFADGLVSAFRRYSKYKNFSWWERASSEDLDRVFN